MARKARAARVGLPSNEALLAQQQAQAADRRRKVLAAAALLLLVDRRSRAGLRAALRLPLSLHAIGGRAPHTHEAIRTMGRRGVVALRTGARAASRQAWVQQTGLAPQVALQAWPVDELRAARAADSLAAQWADRLDAAREAAIADGDLWQSERAAMLQAGADLDPAIERTAVTEAVSAWADEVDTLTTAAVAANPGALVVHTWEAILDTRTCPSCEALNGKSVRWPATFEADPPLHPRCRCFVSSAVYYVDAA